MRPLGGGGGGAVRISPVYRTLVMTSFDLKKHTAKSDKYILHAC